MDTEEDIEIKQAKHDGRPETDEGPYYHESWWESYKGSVKGKLGGSIIGAALGAAIGATAAIILVFTAPTIAVLPIIAGFAGAGMLYGAHEFSEIGKIVGSDAATAEKLEHRIKNFENSKFAELKQEIRELKNGLLGKKSAPETAAKPEESYRTEHCDDHCPPNQRKWVFWNIAAIGAIIGIAAGSLLALSGLDEMLLHHLGSAGAALHPIAHTATIMATGLFGASFGVNRDMFRQLFDRTDLLFKGILVKSPAKAIEKEVETPAPAVTTIVYDGTSECSKSDTYHRDYVMAQAKKALLGMDHTKARPN